MRQEPRTRTATANREPGTANREPGTGNPEPGTGNPEPGTGNPEPGTRYREPGFSLVELCVVIVVLGILFVMASALFSRARVAGNESAAIGAMRVINSSQFAYLNGCGHGYYATSFVILGTKTAGNSQGYISEDFGGSTTPTRNGYQFAMSVGAEGTPSGTDCMGRPTQTAYYASAIPMVQGRTGSRSFATNQRGAVWQANGPTPPSEPFGPPATRAE